MTQQQQFVRAETGVPELHQSILTAEFACLIPHPPSARDPLSCTRLHPFRSGTWPLSSIFACRHSPGIPPQRRKPPLLERDEPRGVGGADAGLAVLDGLVGDGVLRQVAADHVRLDLDLQQKWQRGCQRASASATCSRAAQLLSFCWLLLPERAERAEPDLNMASEQCERIGSACGCRGFRASFSGSAPG